MRLLHRWRWRLVKLLASSDALIADAVQLSELSDANGRPLPGRVEQWRALAERVAVEMRQIRGDLGTL